MKKLLAILISGLFASAAFAQAPANGKAVTTDKATTTTTERTTVNRAATAPTPALQGQINTDVKAEPPVVKKQKKAKKAKKKKTKTKRTTTVTKTNGAAATTNGSAPSTMPSSTGPNVEQPARAGAPASSTIGTQQPAPASTTGTR